MNDESFFVDHFQEALEAGAIQPFFQPVYRSLTGRIYGAETLARWIDPEHGMISPADFIPTLERSGQIYELDMEMLRRTCELYRKLCDHKVHLNSFSINLSRHDFVHENLFSQVVDTLSRYEVPREAIKLEITESLMLEDAEAFERAFRQFHEAGFSIWLDDFGSGYSSLNMLQNYSFDLIKFDMLFLRNFNVKGRKLLSSLISMAKTLEIHTLTEGVETKEQSDFLKNIGCEVQQGFYYSKPISEVDILGLLSKEEDNSESREDRKYWNEIGYFNFLSANPMEDYVEREKNRSGEGDILTDNGNSIALVECSQNQAHYVYVSSGYMARIQELGYGSLDELESVFNDHRSDQYLLLNKLIADAVEKNQIQVIEYSNNDVYYRLFAKLLARKRDKAMLALRLSTFESEREIETSKEMLNYGNALFSIFDLVVVIYPDSNMATRIYTSQNLPTYDREGSIKESVERFCEAQVDPTDQKRYLRFMDFRDMTERIEASSRRFIQGFFRMRWMSDTSRWHTARVTQLPASSEKAYMLTIQIVQGSGIRWLDMIAREQAELLEPD